MNAVSRIGADERAEDVSRSWLNNEGASSRAVDCSTWIFARRASGTINRQPVRKRWGWFCPTPHGRYQRPPDAKRVERE